MEKENKYIKLIDSYLEEPNNICKEWVECLQYCRNLIIKNIQEQKGKL